MFARKLSVAIVALGFCSVVFAAPAAADSSTETLTVDSERSKISWVSEAPAEKIVGEGSQLEGEIEWSLDNLEETKGRISFPVESMKTGNSLRDKHLQQEDWLNAKENPKITFEIEGLKDVEKSKSDGRIDVEATIVGKVTVNGVTNSEEATAEIAILPDKNLVRVQPELTVELDGYEIEGRQGAVGKDVAETIEIEGVIYGNWK